MTKNALIEKIKNQLKSLVNSKFAEVKSGDLVITSPDEVMIVGSEVFTTDADGVNIPLADGDYVLDNGNSITVVGGKITAIMEKEEEVDLGEMPKEEKMEEMPVEEVKTEEEVSAPDMVDEMKKVVERLAKCEEMISSLMKEKEMMEQKFSALAAMPSTSPIEAKPAEFASIETKKSEMGVDVSAIRERIRKNNR